MIDSTHTARGMVGVVPRVHGCGNASTTTSYIIIAADELPTVDLSITLASKICQSTCATNRLSEAWISLVDRWIVPAQLLMVIAAVAAVSVFFVSDRAINLAAGLTTVFCGAPLIGLTYATLSWEMIRLLMSTFEFWFLTLVNLVNTIVLGLLFGDIRGMALIVPTLFYQLTLFGDANIHTRRVELRFLTLGSPAMLIVVVCCVLRLTPNLHFSSWTFLNNLDEIDLIVNGNFIIGFFTSLKMHRNKRYLLSTKASIVNTAAASIVPCHMYFPNCRLVEAAPNQRISPRRRISTTSPFPQGASDRQTLQPARSATAQYEYIDPFQSLLKSAHFWLPYPLVTTISWIAIVIVLLAHVFDQWTNPLTTPAWTYFAGFGVVSTVTAFVLFLMNCQKTLVWILLHEGDVWFASLQFTLVTLCVCDVVRWGARIYVPVAAWIWFHWILVLDAISPPLKKKLRVLVWVVHMSILLYLLSLLKSFFYDTTVHHNRVLVDFVVFRKRVQMNMLSFLASKIFTVLVWAVRLFWRDLYRPRDVFRSIKLRVQYMVPVDRRVGRS